MSTTTNTIIYHCRAKAKSTGKRCRNTIADPADVCRLHTNSEREFPAMQVEVTDTTSQPKQYPVSVEEIIFKGQPVISIRQGKFDFRFGVSKARIILEHLDVIRQFVAGQTIEPTAQIRLGEFDGHPILGFHNLEGEYVFSAGITKYNKILDNLPAVQDWFNKHTVAKPVVSEPAKSLVVTEESLKATGLSPEQATALFTLLKK